MNPLLNIRKLTYSNPDGIISDLSITLDYGEIHAIVAKNTSDQSLIIAALLAFQESAEIEGDIIMSNKKLPKGKQSFKSHRIQIMHATTQVAENLSVTENLYESNLPRIKFSPFINWRSAKKMAYETLNEASIDINPSTRMSELSRESKRIIYLLRLLSDKPKIMILQEPFEGLSDSGILVVKDLIRRFVSNGGSILFLTKQWENALMISNRISILANGHISNEMSTDEATKNPTELVRRIENINMKNKSITDVEDKETQKLLEAVFKAAEFLTSEFELNDVLTFLITEAIKALNATNGSIILFDQKTNTVIDEFNINNSNTPFQKLDPSIIFDVVESRKVFWANRYSADKKHGYICAPISSRECYGVLYLNFPFDKDFTERELKYLKAFSRHAALAIEDTRLMGNSVLIMESHHRIKNNLQTVSNLITLQRNALLTNPDKTIHAVLDSISGYIKSIAQVHDLMSKDHMGRSIINLKDLILSIIQLLDADPYIKVNMNLEDIFIPYNKATSIALIINELITNSYKHAFKNINTGEINISSYKTQDFLIFIVMDNGNGLPESFDLNNSKGLGLSVIQTMIKSEFKGKLLFKYVEIGCSVEVIVPLNKLFS